MSLPVTLVADAGKLLRRSCQHWNLITKNSVSPQIGTYSSEQRMTSSQLQWAAISGAAALGLGLLVYDLRNKTVETTEPTNVKLKIEEVSKTLHRI